MSNSRYRKGIFLLVIFYCFIVSLSGCSLEKNLTVDEYLKKNHSSINLNEETNLKKFSILDDSLDKYDVFLAGEGHATKINYDLQLALLKYYNEKAGVRYFLIEFGYGLSAYLNEYLYTGNEGILEDIRDELKGTASWSKEFLEFWKKLREYNMSLPDDRKITIVGIDIESQFNTVVKYLYSCMPKDTPPSEIKTVIMKFLDGKKERIENLDSLRKVIEPLQNDIKKNPDIYKKYIGDKFFSFNFIVDNVINSINAYSSSTNLTDIREQSIYNNFKRIYNNLPKGKYFGQFGFEHIYQSHCSTETFLGEQDRFATYLNKEDSPVKNRVLSILYGYKDCFRMDKENNYQEAAMTYNLADTNNIEKYSKTDITIFKLNGVNSPFSKKLYFIIGTTEGVTTDYFQYVLLIKNSKGTTPLE